MSEHQEIAKISKAQRQLETLMSETSSPAVLLALQQAVYYCHLAQDFLGADGLSPDVDLLYKSD